LAGGPGSAPDFGIVLTANCHEPDNAIVTWRIEVDSNPTQGTSSPCLDGSFGDSPGPGFTVNGCGAHTLDVVVQDVSFKPAASAMRFPFRLC
jgi:hypothetical protein